MNRTPSENRLILWAALTLITTFVMAMVGREVPGIVLAVLIGLMCFSAAMAIRIGIGGKG